MTLVCRRRRNRYRADRPTVGAMDAQCAGSVVERRQQRGQASIESLSLRMAWLMRASASVPSNRTSIEVRSDAARGRVGRAVRTTRPVVGRRFNAVAGATNAAHHLGSGGQAFPQDLQCGHRLLLVPCLFGRGERSARVKKRVRTPREANVKNA
jgi:hypothetical protein